jgi:hypothetical protein
LSRCRETWKLDEIYFDFYCKTFGAILMILLMDSHRILRRKDFAKLLRNFLFIFCKTYHRNAKCTAKRRK